VIKLKRIVSETGSCALLAVLALLLLVREAHAYLDPGTGSYIIQILIAGLFGALFMLKVFWGRIVGFFGKGSSESEAIGSICTGPRSGYEQRGPDKRECKSPCSTYAIG
jgi:hypothetical protein